MRKATWRSTAATVLLFALLLPILAACGGAPSAPAGEPTAAAGEPTTGAAAEAPTAAAEAPSAAAEQPTGGAATDTGTAQAGVLRVNLEGEPSSIDPQKISFLDGITMVMHNYQALMSFDLDMKPIPAAAESYEVSEDGLTYTFKIRPDSKYSDGTPLTAQNFEYAWKRLADPETAGEYQSLPCGIIKGYSEYSAATCQGLSITDTLALDLPKLRDELGVRAIDDQTLEIELTAPAPYFLSMAALWIGVPVREEDVAKGEDWWYDAENFVGNGPFQLTEWEHDQRAVYEKNPNYVGPLTPKIDRIELYMITESQVAFQAYQNGELDVLRIAPEDLATVQGDPTLSAELVPYPGSCTLYFGFNLNRAPFDNPQVRQAFAQAIDREAYVRDIFQGLGTVATGLIPTGFPGHQDIQPWPFDPEKAKATLAEAGYPNGEGLPEIKLSYEASARNNARFEWVANQLRTNLGIEPVLDPVDGTAYSALFTDPETTPPFFSLSWCADYPDPQNWISIFRTGGVLNDRLGYNNPEFDELTKQADIEQDATKRAELYAQAEEILLTDAPIVVTRYNGSYQLVKPWVQGITEETITPIDYTWYGFFNMADVSVEP
jgi:oligopeptide transport system substrate-binding protein